MTARHSLAAVASLVGEPTRAAMLLALLDGRALPASALAREARLSLPATSLHLAKMTQGGLLAVRQDGRHRYYRLASADVAHALEALGVIATRPVSPAATTGPAPSPLRAARTCYDHLAGVLSVAFAEMLVQEGRLRAGGPREFDVTRAGVAWFAEAMHLDVPALAIGRRSVSRSCLDWTERRPHLAGALGAAVLHHLLEQRWIARLPDTRAVRVTQRGQAGLASFGVIARVTG